MTAERVSTNFYIDNLLDLFDTEEEAIQVVNDYTELLKKGWFRLIVNQPTLNLNLDDLPLERILGVLYDSKSDSFGRSLRL